MKIETALKTPRTVQQLIKLTGLSRGGVLNKLKKIAKTAGKDQRAGERGPAAKRYVLRAKRATKRATPAEVAVDANREATGLAPAAETTPVETTPPTYEAPPQVA